MFLFVCCNSKVYGVSGHGWMIFRVMIFIEIMKLTVITWPYFHIAVALLCRTVVSTFSFSTKKKIQANGRLFLLARPAVSHWHAVKTQRKKNNCQWRDQVCHGVMWLWVDAQVFPPGISDAQHGTVQTVLQKTLSALLGHSRPGGPH